MERYVIGKVISVSGSDVEVELFPVTEDSGKKSGVPDDMKVSVDSKDSGPTPILIGQPGSFVSIAMGAYELLCMVVNIKMVDKPFLASEFKQADLNGGVLIANIKRHLSIIPVGTIDAKGEFERGADVLPTVNNTVYAVLPSTIDKVFESFSDGTFSIGHLSLLPTQLAKINLDAFLSRHAAILGQTGGGKSWTVASFLQKIQSTFKKSTIVLFDLHGEYKNVFTDADYIDANEIELPYWLMNSEELLGLMVDRSESAAPNQIAKFKELLQGAKETHAENKELGIPKITIDTPVYFDFDAIINDFQRLDVEMVSGANGRDKQGPLYGQFTRMLMRVNSRLNDKRYDLIFHPQKYKTSASMDELFRKILGEEKAVKKIVILDMSSIPFDVRTSVISLVMRCLFDFAYWHKKVKNESYPISVFCDEAHLYLNDKDPACEAARISAERIAKEGRKYGISLTVISQRPREVSATILSQAGSFLCLRLSNPEDQSYVKSLLPDSVQGIVNMFATLRRGECILLGDSVIMPTRIKVNKPNPTPDSNDCSFYKQWSEDHKVVEVPKVLEAWRKQQV